MRWERRQGAVLWWCTHTTAPGGDAKRLRVHFQVWRKRLAKHLGVPVGAIAYRMVDTREGLGVLHFVLALPAGCGGEFLPYGVLGEWWLEIHGARQVRYKRVRGADSDIRAVSHYAIAQYMAAGQGDALGRFSGSRCVARLRSWRDQVLAAVTSRVRAYRVLHLAGPALAGPVFDKAWREVRAGHWREFRRCWADVLQRGWCEFDGERWFLSLTGRFERV